MIIKTVSVPVIGRVATIAHVHESRDGIVIYDLFDAEGILAKSRYSVDADAPFILTAEDINNLAIIEPIVDIPV